MGKETPALRTGTRTAHPAAPARAPPLNLHRNVRCGPGGRREKRPTKRSGRGAIHVLSPPAAQRHPLPEMLPCIPGGGLGCGQQVERALTAARAWAKTRIKGFLPTPEVHQGLKASAGRMASGVAGIGAEGRDGAQCLCQ